METAPLVSRRLGQVKTRAWPPVFETNHFAASAALGRSNVNKPWGAAPSYQPVAAHVFIAGTRPYHLGQKKEAKRRDYGSPPPFCRIPLPQNALPSELAAGLRPRAGSVLLIGFLVGSGLGCPNRCGAPCPLGVPLYFPQIGTPTKVAFQKGDVDNHQNGKRWERLLLGWVLLVFDFFAVNGFFLVVFLMRCKIYT